MSVNLSWCNLTALEVNTKSLPSDFGSHFQSQINWLHGGNFSSLTHFNKESANILLFIVKKEEIYNLCDKK